MLRSLCVSVALCVLVSLCFACDSMGALTAPYRTGIARTVRARRVYNTGPVPNGAVRVRGIIRAPAERVTPRGTRAALVVYTVYGSSVSVARGARQGSATLYCFNKRIDGAVLELTSGERFELRNWNGLWLPETGLYEPPSHTLWPVLSYAMLPRTAEYTTMPSSLDQECTGRYPNSRTYNEYVVADGAALEVSGCVQNGVLSPCGDGADALCGSGNCEEFASANMRASR